VKELREVAEALTVVESTEIPVVEEGEEEPEEVLAQSRKAV
jgi:hypothetical protein